MRDPVLRRLWSLIEPGPAWVTGGYVRDTFLGRHSHDIDLVLPGNLVEIRSLAERIAAWAGVRAHILGRPPKAVWHIESPSLTVDLWPLGDGSPAADARRRDLTVNAILMRLPGAEIVDPVGGMEDLERRRLRAVSRANLAADPIRLLRIARFASELPDFGVERRTRRWIAELAPRLAASPHERIGAELLLLLRARAPHRGLELLDETGMCGFLFPPGAGTPPRPLLQHLVSAARLLGTPSQHPIPGAAREAGDAARLGLLVSLLNITNAACCGDYGWPRTARRHALTAAKMVPEAMDAATGSAPRRRLFIFRCGESFPTVLTISSALAATSGLPIQPWRRWWRQWRRNAGTILHPRPLLSPEEAGAILGISHGPRFGRALAALKQAQILGRVRSAASARTFLVQLAGEPRRTPDR